MRNRFVFGFFCCCLLLSFLSVSCAEFPAFDGYKDAVVHDPSVVRSADGTWYVFGSHMQAARSSDLMKWKLISRDAQKGCRLVENVQTEMKEALSYARSSTFWAPDVIQLSDGRWYMYYCCCEGSCPLSALGLAVADDVEGPYHNVGILLKSGMDGYDATQLPNVVDPCVFFDKEGKLWMVYGSYSGGIFILEMDPETGYPLDGQGYGKKLLGKNHSRIEAPYILYSPETGYYYLFLSFGGLNAADGYNIRVCRSKNPDGPYLDAAGNDMTECGGADGTYFNDPDYEGYGVKLMGGYTFEPSEGERQVVYRSPGHCSAYFDEKSGQYYLFFHTRFKDRGETYSLRVHQFFMNEDGWPVVLPLRYSGENNETVDSAVISGNYRLLLHERDINLTEHVSVPVQLAEDGTITGSCNGEWKCADGKHVHMTLDGKVCSGIINYGYVSSSEKWLVCITLLDAEGGAVWLIAE